MFTKKLITSILLSVIFIIGLSFTSYGKTPLEKMPEFQKYQNLVFKSSDLNNYIIKTSEISWNYNTDLNDNETPLGAWEYAKGNKGKIINNFAVDQEIQTTNKNIKLSVKYGVFSNTNEAHKAIIYQVKTISVVMRTDPQFESELIQIPDEAYWVSDGSAIIFRIKNVCVLLGCSKANNINTQRETTINFANQIIGKILFMKSSKQKL